MVGDVREHPATLGAVRVHLVVYAAAVFVPVPFLDDVIAGRSLARAMQEVARTRGVALPDAEARVLAGPRGSWVLGCLWALAKWPVKKLLRYVLFLWSVKDAVDALAEGAHRLHLLELALERGRLLGEAEAHRAHVDRVLHRHRISPVTRWLLRKERPELTHAAPADAAGRMLHALARHGGGARVAEVFVAELGPAP